MVEIYIDERTSGGRLDKLLTKYLNRAPSSFIYKMLRKKNIVVNEKKASGSKILASGDVIKIYIKDETLAKFKNTVENYAILIPDSNENKGYSGLSDLICYEDENILAVNKSVGLLSQSDKSGKISLNDLVVDYLGKTDLFTPGISNRLDRNTGGIVLIGKNPASSRELNIAIKNKALSKYYLALVKGNAPDFAYLNDFYVKDSDTNKVKILSFRDTDLDKAEPVLTEFSKISSNSACSLLDINLLTGKPHQIRAHLAFYGLPIVGDPKYGDSDINLFFSRKYGLKRQFLHAYKIKFNKMSGILEYLNGTEIYADISNDLRNILTEEKIWLPGKAED